MPLAGMGEIANGNVIITTNGDSYTIAGDNIVTKTRPTDLIIAAFADIKYRCNFRPSLFLLRIKD